VALALGFSRLTDIGFTHHITFYLWLKPTKCHRILPKAKALGYKSSVALVIQKYASLT